MTYIKTKLKRSIDIDAIITLHYFEYMKDYVFDGESHDFWEFVFVDSGNLFVTAGDKEVLDYSQNRRYHLSPTK